MSKRSPRLLVEDILEAASKIERYVRGLDSRQFLDDDKTSDAVVRNLEIIGEAAARLPVEVRNQFPGIEWSKIIGLRNRVVHEYFGVDLDIVWFIIQNDLPALAAFLEEMKLRLQA
ncbi:MAG: DUF86 domain-containing protein [Proteobacteria bacterium]|nr:DUF86 domain-containing protein [Pseudomonadota bacterium]